MSGTKQALKDPSIQVHLVASELLAQRQARDPNFRQAEVARRMGCAKSTLNQMLIGTRSFSLKWVIRYCHALGIRTEEFWRKVDGALEDNKDFLLNRLFTDIKEHSIHARLIHINELATSKDLVLVDATLEALELRLEKKRAR